MKTIKGFTLVELMVTIAVLAIIATLAAPNLSQILKNTKVKTSSGDIFNFLQQARTEAVRLGKTVTICGSVDGTTCSTANKTNWSTGLIAKSSASSTPIQKLTFENSQLFITAPETISFNPVGSTNAEHAISVTIAGADTYSVCVEVIGRAFKSKTGC
ncbi:GspH/FimT family pseudopilin [Acinetobacter zhairhuonensis]|jgi:prepilin-type N-terminal cleavage/methylation domain-containing protein|uniref:GspH/FimT family pseudopilin n=1 Tax=Acinetobacter sp. A7.4 TaxID=2919921 RepID=UPI001F4E4091|nr:GspH/FimT family pseudopilin [Acinetobacter sp. A7.4]MCJ8161091.1 GspH/FimT family pseudopilin [Acinetobacter sp. A7.4]